MSSYSRSAAPDATSKAGKARDLSGKETHKSTVFVVDDDESVRRSLVALMESVGYGCETFKSAVEFLEHYVPVRAGCLILDIRMPQMSGIELQRALNVRGLCLPLIFITGHGDIAMAVEAMKQGAFDFVEKPFRDQNLLDRVNRALELDAEMRRELAGRDELRRRADTLTPREREVMQSIVAGKANKVIALDLALSERTVEIHRAKVMEKMDARSVAQLVKMSLSLED
jgi:two-component system response regulator FixJ